MMQANEKTEMRRSLSDELALEANYADHMAAMAQVWMRKAQEAERLIGTLVLAAGGEIRIHDGHRYRASEIVLERWEEKCSMEIVFKAKVTLTVEV